MFCCSFYQRRPPSKSKPRKLEVFPSQSPKKISEFQTWAQVSLYFPLLLFWQLSGILLVSMDQALMFFMVLLKEFLPISIFFSTNGACTGSNLAASSPFLITLRTRENQNKINWQSKKCQVIKFLSHNIIFPPKNHNFPLVLCPAFSKDKATHFGHTLLTSCAHFVAIGKLVLSLNIFLSLRWCFFCCDLLSILLNSISNNFI